MIDLYLDLREEIPASFLELTKVLSLERKHAFRFRVSEGRKSSLLANDRLFFEKERPEGALALSFEIDPLPKNSSLYISKEGKFLLDRESLLCFDLPYLKDALPSLSLRETLEKEGAYFDLGKSLEEEISSFFASLSYLDLLEERKAERDALKNYFARMVFLSARNRKHFRKEDYFLPLSINRKEKPLLLLRKGASYKEYRDLLLLLEKGHDLEGKK